ncbi:hypothetical protein [Helicobacter cetorum]|uniref:hypothetical protein n=1 Tax=Helicobacter cetorum TaxID=138563 RepID=UPI00130537B6|nr:hypothetical protein [Helicobacter cetorum]
MSNVNNSVFDYLLFKGAEFCFYALVNAELFKKLRFKSGTSNLLRSHAKFLKIPLLEPNKLKELKTLIL